MIKRIAILGGLSLAALLLLAACNGGGEQPQPTVSISPSPTVAQPSPTPEPTATPTPTPEPQTAVTTALGIYIVLPDGRGLRGPIAGVGFRWSPSGTRLAVVTSNCDRILSVINPDSGSGSVEEIVSFPDVSGAIGQLKWAPDSERLLIGVSEPSGATRAFLVNASGQGEPVELFQSARFEWSPDSSKVAYIEGSELKIQDVRDGTTTTLATDATATPVWSPDGTRIAFAVSSGELNTDLVIIDVNGSGSVVITAGSSPEWTTDGERLVLFLKTDEPGRPVIGVARTSDGSVEKTLRTGFDFDISRDGRIIAIYDNLQTHTEIEVFRDSESLGIVSGDLMPVGDVVALSPDGFRLIFNAEGPGPRDLYLVNADGTGLRKLVESTRGIGRADWSTDGRNIAFVSAPPIGLECG